MSTAILALAIIAYVKLLDYNRGKTIAELIDLTSRLRRVALDELLPYEKSVSRDLLEATIFGNKGTVQK